MTLKEWVHREGGISDVARRLGVCRQSVHNWVNTGNTPAANMIRRIVEESNGEITAEMLVFPKPKRRVVMKAGRT